MVKIFIITALVVCFLSFLFRMQKHIVVVLINRVATEIEKQVGIIATDGEKASHSLGSQQQL